MPQMPGAERSEGGYAGSRRSIPGRCTIRDGTARLFCHRWRCSADLPPGELLGRSAAGGDARPICCRVEMSGRSAAGGDARPICRRWGCSADLPPVEMPGSSAAGGDARQFCHRWRCPAVLPPVQIRGGPLCRRSLPGGGYASPRLAQDIERWRARCRRCPPPRRHSPATRASRACREGSTGRVPTRNAARSSYRTPRAASAVGAGTPHGHHGLPGGTSLHRLLRGSCGFP
jgi:hypothetical protein